MSPTFEGSRALGAGLAALLACGTAASAWAADPIEIGLVTTETSPLLANMKEGPAAKALGVEFQRLAGNFHGHRDAQVAAIGNIVSSGVSGIVLTAADTTDRLAGPAHD